MSKVRVTAIEPFNSYKPGESFELPEREAEQALAKGLVRVGGVATSKAAKVSAEGVNPSLAAGGGRRSSASPAARASARKTAGQSANGGPEAKDGA
ncbi:hypothetical protein LVB77_14605 [Lysobacter sp. 5GHs7-4]|uniref:hypothetical protein n=1 Tax=Lysobacter sp. 5GHs7-4 TaxID=2904253 RepID=UPI001E33B993|nr:hypothetical protein [Lysobacter sp. 5GHs7-4]UHQ21897.1 hypothetical protein LVB77_14605 [Lysobacter sp. 5GHs7-4]